MSTFHRLQAVCWSGIGAGGVQVHVPKIQRDQKNQRNQRNQFDPFDSFDFFDFLDSFDAFDSFDFFDSFDHFDSFDSSGFINERSGPRLLDTPGFPTISSTSKSRLRKSKWIRSDFRERAGIPNNLVNIKLDVGHLAIRCWTSGH